MKNKSKENVTRAQLPLPHGTAIKSFVREIQSRSFEREIIENNNVLLSRKIADRERRKVGSMRESLLACVFVDTQYRRVRLDSDRRGERRLRECKGEMSNHHAVSSAFDELLRREMCRYVTRIFSTVKTCFPPVVFRQLNKIRKIAVILRQRGFVVSVDASVNGYKLVMKR